MRIRSFVLPLLALGLALPQAAAADTIIVKRAPGLDAAERADVRADAGVKLVETLAIPRTEAVSVPAGRADEALRALAADPGVVYAEVNRRRHAFGPDPLLGDLWGLENVGQTIFGSAGTSDADMDVTEAWATSTGAGVVVAVADSGIESSHPDLSGQIAAGGWDFVEDDADPQDPHGHGTHVSGTIAAARGNDIGVAGVAPDARLKPYRVLGADGSGTAIASGDAFAAAGQSNVRVLNASLGDDNPSEYEKDAIASSPNTLFVVAAGNDGRDVETTPTYPCAYALPNVLCVGASTMNDEPAGFSNYGASSVDVFAPGSEILSTYFGDYAGGSGTSMASPHVAGIAALLLEEEPNLTAVELKTRILQGTDTLDALAGLAVSGGRANAEGALASTYQAPDPPVVVDPPVVTPPDDDGGALDQPPADRDGDGRDDASDGCPRERAATRDGCPLPAVRSLSTRTRKRVLTVRVRTSRAASVRITVERRKCKSGRCRWARVTRRTLVTRGDRVKLTVRRLRGGRHRAVVVLSSSAGRAAAVTKAFRVR